jgi:tetraacyldisaccharide 4'-kinase
MLPLVPLYLAGSALRWAGVKPKRLAGPVVSIGNLSAGGTGKTPFVIALAKLLMAQGIAVDVLSRGYGRTGSGADRVDPEGRAEAFGDEPLLIAREAGVPVFVGAKRLEAGALAEREFHAQVHLLDDGFQHRQLYRDVDIVLVNSEDLGDRLLPAGNLREPVSALRRATVFAVPSGDDAAVERLRALGLTQPVWRFRREMVVPELAGPVVAFCGIARPEQFFAGLEAAGVSIAARQVFPDHHPFTDAEMQSLQALVHRSSAVALITTEKDRVRLEPLAAKFTVSLMTAGLRVALQDGEAAVDGLRARLGI